MYRKEIRIIKTLKTWIYLLNQGLEASVGQCCFLSKFEFLNTFESLDFLIATLSTAIFFFLFFLLSCHEQILSTNAINTMEKNCL